MLDTSNLIIIYSKSQRAKIQCVKFNTHGSLGNSGSLINFLFTQNLKKCELPYQQNLRNGQFSHTILILITYCTV